MINKEIQKEEIESKNLLTKIPIFTELSIQQLRQITAVSKLKQYSKQEILFRENDHYAGFYILLKGVIKVYKISSVGKESIVHIIKPFNLFADIPLFEGGNYPVNAEALEESLVLFVPKEKFILLIKDNSDLCLKMLAGFAKRLKSLVNQLEDLTSKEIPNRLAKYILKEIKSAGTDKLPEPFVKLSIPKSTIAAFLGTITETLSRTFKKLQNEGVIKVSGKKIFVTDLKRLKELAK